MPVALATALAALCGAFPAAGSAAEPVTITNYTSPSQRLEWNTRSQYKQPWRSYMDTVPATTLLNAVGINFNVKQGQAEAIARLLGETGFKRARIEISWNTLDYENPETFTAAARRGIEERLIALRENGIRPLILLNANSGSPCPAKPDTVTLTQPAAAGSTVLHISPAEVGKVIPGRTGIASGGTAAAYLFSSVSPDGTVHLSAPLGALKPYDVSQPIVRSLAAGPLAIETLLDEPFHPAHLENGAPNPRFEPTMQGWLQYVGMVTREVKAIMGSEEFDVEVWNELSFGSRFLDVNGYYSPPIEGKTGDTNSVILSRTVEYLRNPANGVPNVGIGNGFSNQAPWWNGTESPVGLTAIDKHPYAGRYSFPEDMLLNGNRPLDALGRPSGWQDGERRWHESFTPTYNAFFPEYFLSGLQTETMVNDLAPYSTYEGRQAAHGRYSHPAGGAPPQIWMTEVNLNPESAGPVSQEMTPADVRHIESKNVLRYLTAFVNKGVTAIDLFAAERVGGMSVVDSTFTGALRGKEPAYPGMAAGGETTEAVRRLTDAMRGAEAITSPRSLSLESLTDFEDKTEFEGNGTAAFPPLYDREVLAFLPFQVTNSRFVVPVYVMTRNVARNYRPGAPRSDPTRFDLPEERYRMQIGGVDGEAASVTASDPLTGSEVPVTIVSRSANSVEVEVEVTDSPRLLEIEDEGQPVPAGPSVPAEGATGSPGGEVPAETPAKEKPGKEVPPIEVPAVKETPAQELPSLPVGEPMDPAELEKELDEGPLAHPLPVGTPSATPVSVEDAAGPATAGQVQSPAGQVAAPAVDAGTEPGLVLAIRSPHTLIQGESLTVVGTCGEPCRPQLEGIVTVGSTTYHLRPDYTSARASTAAGHFTIQMRLGGAAASKVRSALHSGLAARITVTASAKDSPGAATARRVLGPRT